jgi:hypothetical protein
MFDDIIGNISKKILFNAGNILQVGQCILYDQTVDKTDPSFPCITMGVDYIGKIIADNQDLSLAEYWLDLLHAHDTIIHYRVRAYYLNGSRISYPFYRFIL